jgi:hydroxymethylpyrimidine pyrophosphatase-like HAD family hydrolase
MLLIDYYDQTAEENFRKDILAKYGDRLNSFFSCKEYIEIIPKTCGKGLALRRLAEILGIPVGTVKSRMSNAIKKLKEFFDERRS